MYCRIKNYFKFNIEECDIYFLINKYIILNFINNLFYFKKRETYFDEDLIIFIYLNFLLYTQFSKSLIS